MIYWLVDNRTSVLVFLGALALVLFVAWWKTRDRRLLWGIGSVAALAAVVGLLGFFVETDEKKILHAIEWMAEGVKARNGDRIFNHISDEFTIQGHTKSDFRDIVDRVLRKGAITEIVVWEFGRAKFTRPKGGKATGQISFKVKPKGIWDNQAFYRCDAEFVLDADGQWRLKGFQVYNAFVDDNVPIQIPSVMP